MAVDKDSSFIQCSYIIFKTEVHWWFTLYSSNISDRERKCAIRHLSPPAPSNFVKTGFCHRIDSNNVIKVADFGLSEDIYAKNYYRQSDTEECKVKLPIKWMALESLQDGVFSEKTDVVS